MEEEELQELKRKLEDEDLDQEQRINLLTSSLSKALNSAALQPDGGVSSSLLKSRLYLSGVLSLCVTALNSRKLQNDWSAMATLAHLTCCCCVGVEPGRHSEAFHRLFLPSVMDAVLSLAGQLMRRSECWSQFRKTMKDSVGRLLEDQTHLSSHVLSSAHYEQIQMCDDVAVTLLCIQMWIQICSTNRNFLSELSDDSTLLLLNEAIGQLALSSDPAVGGASIRLILLMASQLRLRLRPLLLSFRGLDSLLDKDWRGRGFDQDLEQLIALVQSEQRMSQSEVSTEHVRAACVVQAAWRSYQTRRRVKSLNRAVSTLQRRYRARRRQQQQQREVQRWQEELSYQVFVRRQQARRRFHQKQRRLLQLLPPGGVIPAGGGASSRRGDPELLERLQRATTLQHTATHTDRDTQPTTGRHDAAESGPSFSRGAPSSEGPAHCCFLDWSGGFDGQPEGGAKATGGGAHRCEPVVLCESTAVSAPPSSGPAAASVGASETFGSNEGGSTSGGSDGSHSHTAGSAERCPAPLCRHGDGRRLLPESVGFRHRPWP
ncbi:IQ calmodulin-binding motif-containing protein 1 isoform X2 [Amphiprion ocellaris]|uniref:IQ calmodulin-binding motif-containing protein 1 isoform X2 n=1 Tax=Amphiprion ocellaris TaxID=80972 RepID=UPI00241180D4|nr:IQ calmodulin-binding motif-containing protein 1 isoform X2 [Amphiprion ocellaris]